MQDENALYRAQGVTEKYEDKVEVVHYNYLYCWVIIWISL